MMGELMLGTQFFFSCVIGIYFLIQLKNSKSTKTNIQKDSVLKYERLARLRRIRLSEPLTEKMRPKKEEDIIGQEDGLLALKTALCTPNPQHILIYGNPGIGKTAAARIALELAKKQENSPFRKEASFIEIDATTLRFDERSVADPLIGSVHDPIYQGAGAYGSAGIPQPKSGAVTKAHGGVLFVDEIGELHPIQMNKLLKVLEDRKVYFESAYYASEDENIPKYIHDIFQNGLPADFRLIGATTRSPEELPPALRSRCVEVFFKNLTQDAITKIIENTIKKDAILIEHEAKSKIPLYATNGRDAVNILQSAYNKALIEKRQEITLADIEWVIKSAGYSKRISKKLTSQMQIGKVNGLAVTGLGEGMVLTIESVVQKVKRDSAQVKISGIVEEEQMKQGNGTSKRKSMAMSSLENVLTLLKIMYTIDINSYFIHVNFPTGIPVDGPSAGVAMFCSIYSALFQRPLPMDIAMTGEVTIHGEVYPVGGVTEKILAAKEAGAKTVFIPKENMEKIYEKLDVEIVPVGSITELVEKLWETNLIEEATSILHG